MRAAQLGKRVALVERERAGGTCLNWGCIPTKALIRNAEVYTLVKKAADFGIHTGPVSFDWSKQIARSRGVTDRIAKGIEFLLKKNKIDAVTGTARLLDNRRVAVGDKILSADKILLATGARPRLIPGFTPDGRRLLTSREAMILPELPESMLIIGGGAIGVEFAYFFNAFGAKVTLVESLDAILPKEDREISTELAKIFTRSGITIRTGTQVTDIVTEANYVTVSFSGAVESREQFATVLCAVGVEANLDFVSAPEQIALENGFVKTGGDYQTSLPGVYAAGDLIGPPWLAHVASYEAIQAIEGIFSGHTPKRPKVFPGCTYCHPQVASVGLTEEECQSRGLSYTVGKYPFLSSGKALAAGDNAGFVKLIREQTGGKLLGAHIIGGEATELISEMALGINLELTAHDIASTIHAHPTLSEIVFEAAEVSLGRAIHA
ncbi:dihydrolipoyl dehydrogenase [Oscillatoria laete-virens NRMC-F 0139]|nr:dihydrolipoyl dehydrogenase [Oscillatoria laete-virens NRMC-F 0139]